MANTGLLVLTNPTQIRKLLPIIKKHVLKTLYIQYFPEESFVVSGNYFASSKWRPTHYVQTIANIYTETYPISSALDIRVLLTSAKTSNYSVINTRRPVEVVIFDRTYSSKVSDTFIQDCLASTSMGCNSVTFNDDPNDKLTDTTQEVPEEKIYDNVVLGGTFDRLHNGHKILLSEAVLRCKKRLCVGVTDTTMISGKLLWELIEPCQMRIFNVREFLEDIDSTIKHDVVPINDMYGPTKNDPSFEMLVVSEETKYAAEKINIKRLENNLNTLDIHTVGLYEDTNSRVHEESKISSSNQRIRLLGTRLQPPRIAGKPFKPYIIGLTGGIASGKSSVAEKLQKLGAGVVDCDTLTHDLYMPGKCCYKALVETFGRKIVQPDGFIDRRALGDIVFRNKEQLDKLNKLVWPMILEEAKKQIHNLHAKGTEVVVLEAAILIQAKWHNVCHDIWTCIVPQQLAITRVVTRDRLTETEAKSRMKLQPSNVEQVNAASVVICTLWSHEITSEQVQKAWNELQTFLSERRKS